MIDWRIFWSVLAALFTFSFVSAAVTVIVAVVFSYQVESRLSAALHQTQLVAQQRVQARHEKQMREQAARTLSSSQRCVGGTVVDVSGTTYIQHLRAGHPIKCRGSFANEPLR